MKRVAAYTLYSWDHAYPANRLVAPWQQAGVELLRGTQWDQVFPEQVMAAELVVLHRDFPRLAKDCQQVILKARQLGKAVFFDLDDLLIELPPDHPDRLYYYISDALFPILQAVVEADAVTVSTPALQEAVLPLNPNTLLLPTCLDERLWPLQQYESRDHHQPLVIGWINDQLSADGMEECTAGLELYLRQHGEKVLLRVWGMRPPEALLVLANVDWLPDLPTSYSQFAARLPKEHIDLAVIPHGSGVYAECQSPLRYFELSACGIPGIYSRVSPYQDLISDRQNGWLASSAVEWQQALEALAGSAELRSRVAASAQELVRRDWLLSLNVYRWRDLLDEAPHFVAQHEALQPVADQVAYIAAQVQAWQRDLEKRLHEREWEVRATHLQMVRKDRQAGEYIQELTSDPAWRILHKVRRLVRIVSPSGGNDKKGRLSKKAQSADTVPNDLKESINTDGAPIIPQQGVEAPKTFNLIYFSAKGWDSLSDEIRQRAEHFARDGVRVLIISPGETHGVLPSLKTVAEGIFSLFLPDIWSDQYIDWFDILRQDMHIYEAICWVENPDWASLAYRLRNRYGWKIVSTKQPIRPVSSADTISLHSRSDLQLDARFEELQYSEIRSTLDNQYLKASIIILTYNNIGYTRQCLESISAKTAYPNYEVVVVDNASTDGTVEFLQEYAAAHTGIRLVINQENRGFAAGNNQGIAASTGEYIVFLNNDTIVTLGWLSGLISHLRDPAVGAVGPVTNSAGNESKIGVDYSEISDLDDFARRHARAHNGESFEIRMLALFCMLVRRSVIEQVGVLDERFGVGMYEDDDFSLRIRQKGYRLLCAEDVYIHHWGSASFSQIDAERIQRLHIENRAKFEAKWGTEWQPHRWRMDEA